MRLGQRLWQHKKVEQELPGLKIRDYKVFGNDFTDVDLREELCHHSLTEYGKISGRDRLCSRFIILAVYLDGIAVYNGLPFRASP